MPPVTDLQNLPAPLAFIGGVLALAIWFIRALTQLVKEWNDEARADAAKEREKRTAMEAEYGKDVRELTKKVSDLEGELTRVRDDLVAQLRESHEARLRGIRREQQLIDALVRHGHDIPEETP